jgi:hypothetical protein
MEDKNAYKIFVMKREGKRPLRVSKRKEEDTERSWI